MGLSKETGISSLLRVSCTLRLLLLPTRRSVVIGSLRIIISSESFLSESWSGILLLKRRLSTVSLKDSSSLKDILIETRTKIIVGVNHEWGNRNWHNREWHTLLAQNVEGNDIMMGSEGMPYGRRKDTTY